MTKEEAISITRIAEKVDQMAADMITKDLLKAEIGRINEALNAHVEYTRFAASAETKRLDAIRVVDATSVAVANERAVEQASVLASQVAASAETLRGLVATTAAAVAASLSQVSTDLTKRIAELERKQFEAQGRSGVSTPLVMLLAGLGGGVLVYIVQLLITGHP
jgi:hypothetical protein